MKVYGYSIELPEACPNKFDFRIKAILATEKLTISLGLLK